MADIVFSGWPDAVLGDRGLPDMLEVEPASLDPSRETETFKTEQIRMYYRSRVDGCCCLGADGCFIFTHQVAALCGVK